METATCQYERRERPLVLESQNGLAVLMDALLEDRRRTLRAVLDGQVSLSGRTEAAAAFRRVRPLLPAGVLHPSEIAGEARRLERDIVLTRAYAYDALAANARTRERRHANDDAFDRFIESTEELVSAGLVEEGTARAFLTRLPSFDSSMELYWPMVHPAPHGHTGSHDTRAILAPFLRDKASERSFSGMRFVQVNAAESSTHIRYRVYVSPDASRAPGEVVRLFADAVDRVGLAKSLYFKVDALLPARSDAIVAYQTSEVSDEQLSDLVSAFLARCPAELLADESLACVRLAYGVSLAPEPEELNATMRALDFRDRDHPEYPRQFSYHSLVSALIRNAHIVAALDGSDPEYRFVELLRLSGISPWTLATYVEGGMLPSWAHDMRSMYERAREGLYR